MERMIDLTVTKKTDKFIFYTFTMESKNIFGITSKKEYKAFKEIKDRMVNDKFADTGKNIYNKFLYLGYAINAELNRQGYLNKSK